MIIYNKGSFCSHWDDICNVSKRRKSQRDATYFGRRTGVFLFYETREVLIIWLIEFLWLSVSIEFLWLSVSIEVLWLSVSIEVLLLSVSIEVLWLSVSIEVLWLSVSVLHISACSHFRKKHWQNCELYQQICSLDVHNYSSIVKKRIVYDTGP